jgi:hypothetical protein
MASKERTFRVAVFRERRPGRVDRWDAYTRDYNPQWEFFFELVDVVAPNGTEAKRRAIQQCKLKV